MDQYALYLALAPVAVAITFCLAVYTGRVFWGNRGARILTAYLLVVTGLVATNAFELLDPTPGGTLFWAKAGYVFITATPVIWFAFIAYFTNRTRWLRPAALVGLSAPAVITMLLAFTNEWRGLIWREVSFRPVHQFLAMSVEHGTAFWLFAVFGYGVYVSGTLIVLGEFLPSQRLYRAQSIWLLLGSVGPLTANLVYIFGLIPGLRKDYTPIVFALAGVFFAIAMFRHRLFDLAPVARAALIETMHDGVLVFDLKGRLVDVNPAGERIFGRSSQALVGSGREELLPDGQAGGAPPTAWVVEGRRRYFEVEQINLPDGKGAASGSLVLLRDVTEQTLSRQALERVRTELEVRVQQRTAELQTVNASLETRVQARTRFLEAVYKVQALISGVRELDQVLAEALEVVRQAVGADAAAVHLIREDGSLEPAGQFGLTGRDQALMAALIAERGRWKELTWGGETYESLQESLPGLSAPHALAAPVRIKNQGVGLLTLFCRTSLQWEATDIHLVEAVAEQIGLAVEMQRLHEQTRMAAIQGERARMARDLHDSVVQLLYSQSLLADAARASLRRLQYFDLNEYLIKIGEIADLAVREMRLLIYQAPPEALARGGLAEALHNRLEMVERRAGVTAELSFTPGLALPESVAVTLLRIAEEALNNALKHARAKHVQVSVSGEAQAVCLRVSDDGQGFDLAATQAGIGLGSMEARASILNGTCEVRSLIGRGTEVTVRIPLDDGGE